MTELKRGANGRATILAALLREPGTDSGYTVEEIELDPPHANEITVKLVASGLCHSDDHVDTGDIPIGYKPAVGGHEGAGIVVEVGPGVTSHKVGDHVVLSMPNCGRCPSCVSGHTNMCDMAMYMQEGPNMSDGTYRRWVDGDVGVGASLQSGTFATHTVIHEINAFPVAENIPLDKAALVGCGVTTGWGSMVNTAGVQVGDTAVVFGIGGLGINAVQGARMGGASTIVAVDPVEYKRKRALEFGATHTAGGVDEARELIGDLTHGQMADRGVVTVSLGTGELLEQFLSVIGKRGVLVWTCTSPVAQHDVKLSLFELTMWEKQLRGACFGSANARTDIPRLLRHWEAGELMLDELITRTYSLEEINTGYRDMREGRNLRGQVIFDD